MSFHRRDLLRAGVGVALAGAADKVLLSAARAAETVGPAKLPKLPYAYDALEPHIDARTMEIHHGKHHAGYVENLNKALAQHPELQRKNADDVLRNIERVPEEIRQIVINNGGGHVNHTLFWQMMSPKGGKPSGEVGRAIQQAFGSFDQFKTLFSETALKRFGSGWAWLVVAPDGELAVLSTANQDSPYMDGQRPILGVDVWEHAYYLKYQNRRADYVQAWWNVVNWDYVNELYAQARGRK